MIYHLLINLRSRILSVLMLLAFCTMVLSCGEDRTYEYEALTQHNIWMFEQMSDKYLWSSKFTEQKWKDYFASPSDYFKRLTSRGDNDNWSYIIDDTLKVDCRQRGYFHHKDSYGFDYVLIQDPTGNTTKTYARVITVFANSPASRAGLSRNDFIETFDGYKITKNNIERLKSGQAHDLFINRLLANTDEMTYSWGDTSTVKIRPSEYVEDAPFAVQSYVEYNDKVYGYLMCNNLLEKEQTDINPKDYIAELDETMMSLKSLEADEFVLDLRLCNFGSLNMARRLASYIVSDDDLDKVFAKTIWSESLSSNNQTILFDSSLRGKTLGMKRVRIIVSKYTQGAAEWVISALRYALGPENVLLVGTATAGQNVMTQHIGDFASTLHLYPAVAYVADGNDDYQSYAKGFTPDVLDDEFNYANLGKYGTTAEILLYRAVTTDK